MALLHECLVIVEGLFHNQSNFMYLQESFLTILVEHEINLIDYNEGLSDVNAHIWK